MKDDFLVIHNFLLKEEMKVGKLVAFRSIDKKGNILQQAKYTGLPVIEGEKFAIMTIFGEFEPGVGVWDYLPRFYYA